MRFPTFTLFLFLSLGACAMENVTIDDLAWLSGSWAHVGRDSGSVEMWSSPAGGTLLGLARFVKDGRTVDFEYLRIRETDEGSLEYVALPSGQSETCFQLVEMSTSKLVFENLEHDFPQRIIYRLESEVDLVARIEGKVKGEDRAVDFPMKRVESGEEG